MTSFFWISACIGVLNFGNTVRGVASMDIPVPVVSACTAIACQIAGAAL